MMNLIFGMIAVVSLNPDETGAQTALFQMLKDAQVTNRNKLNHGTARFRVKYKRSDATYAMASGTVQWDGPNRRWLYRLVDEKGWYTGGTKSGVGDTLEAAPRSYYMILSNKHFIYNPYTGFLFISEFSSPERFPPLLQMIDVTPSSCWYRCFPPQHAEGRSWTEMIGPDSPAVRTGGQVTIKKEGDLIIQTRHDPDGGIFEATFSIDKAMNVVDFTYSGTNSSAKDQHGIYKWDKYTNNTFYLRSLEIFNFSSNDKSNPIETYKLEIDYLDLKGVGKPIFTMENFVPSLPKNTIINDRIKQLTYPAFKQRDASSAEIEAVVDKVKSRGFMRH